MVYIWLAAARRNSDTVQHIPSRQRRSPVSQPLWCDCYLSLGRCSDAVSLDSRDASFMVRCRKINSDSNSECFSSVVRQTLIGMPKSLIVDHGLLAHSTVLHSYLSLVPLLPSPYLVHDCILPHLSPTHPLPSRPSS